MLSKACSHCGYQSESIVISGQCPWCDLKDKKTISHRTMESILGIFLLTLIGAVTYMAFS